MDLYDILACPICKVHLDRQDQILTCRVCGQAYPILNGVPVVFPHGEVPDIQYEAQLTDRSGYNPWVNRIILQSLCDDQIVLEIGAGNMVLDDPCIIRMDVLPGPYVDVVADVHALPFLPESIDYIFSLAVFEHLRNPFTAAQSIYEVLKDGGYIYHECNFVFAYHGYPHHYFNASMQGLEQVFANFLPLRKGVATYQMPSFALDMVLRSYLKNSHAAEYPHGKEVVKLLQKAVDLDLSQFDIYFSESEAQNVAAGTFFAGIKQKTPAASLIPPVIQQIWANDRELQTRFPNRVDLTRADNLMAWAFQTGVARYPEIERYLSGLQPFNKNSGTAYPGRTYIRSLPFQDAPFGAIGFDTHKSMGENSHIAAARRRSKRGAALSWGTGLQKARQVIQTEGIRALALKVMRYVQNRSAR